MTNTPTDPKPQGRHGNGAFAGGALDAPAIHAALAMLESGLSQKEVARRLGVSKNTIAGLWHRHGSPKSPAKTTMPNASTRCTPASTPCSPPRSASGASPARRSRDDPPLLPPRPRPRSRPRRPDDLAAVSDQQEFTPRCPVAWAAAREILREVAIERSRIRYETLIVCQGPQPCPRESDDNILF